MHGNHEAGLPACLCFLKGEPCVLVEPRDCRNRLAAGCEFGLSASQDADGALRLGRVSFRSNLGSRLNLIPQEHFGMVKTKQVRSSAVCHRVLGEPPSSIAVALRKGFDSTQVS